MEKEHRKVIGNMSLLEKEQRNILPLMKFKGYRGLYKNHL